MLLLVGRYDEGTIMIKVGREEPAISMDVNGGKIIWAKHSDMQQVNLKALPEGKWMKRKSFLLSLRHIVKFFGLTVTIFMYFTNYK